MAKLHLNHFHETHSNIYNLNHQLSDSNRLINVTNYISKM